MIVQTASISAFDGQVNMVPYAAAKGAIVPMVLPMAWTSAPSACGCARSLPARFFTPRIVVARGLRMRSSKT